MSAPTPGRELDRAVALAIFGTDAPHAIMSEWNLPPFSTDIAAAWQVIEKLRELARAQKLWGPKFAIHIPVGDGRWVVELHNDLYGGMSEPHTHDTQWRGIAETAPHAICLAALNAVGAGALPSRETEPK